MTAPSSQPVSSNQNGPHSQLEKTVRRHLNSRFAKPYPAHSLNTFAQLTAWRGETDRPLIFDSYCGVGESTYHIAMQHPESLVVGLDKSAHRLNKHQQLFPDRPENYLLLRADVDDIWRLAAAEGWVLQKHFLLYPNPWPKSAQLNRRCHGSPLFPYLLALGGTLELRSNWPLYVQEFATALTLAKQTATTDSFDSGVAMTPFERKYLQSGHTVWRCTCALQPCL